MPSRLTHPPDKILSDDPSIIVVGRVGAPFGVRGAVHIHSFTEPAQNLIHFSEWFLKLKGKWCAYEILEARPHGKGFVAHLKGCIDRDAAALLTNIEIGVVRGSLPELPEDEYYWTDLIGLKVYTETGEFLGVIDSLFETGSNDVIVVRGDSREHLIPYIPGDYVVSVDIDTQRMEVRWDPEF